MRRKLLAFLGLSGFLLQAASPVGYYRFPTLHEDTIVFTSEGDLWRVGIVGGVAQRLTTHPGTESRAAFSPDGRTLAFSAEYEGTTEVYTMPADGGLPVRQTFEGENAGVVGWTPDSRVVYRTTAYSTLPNFQLATLDPATSIPRLLPLAEASEGVQDQSSHTWYFARLNKQGSSTKRYQGGWVENLWRYTDGQPEAIPLSTDFPGTSRNPMWWQQRVYFVSDRDGTHNLWSMKPDGSDWQQLTRHTDFDIKTAALQAGRIVYARQGDLHLYNLSQQKDEKLNISLASDFDQQREKWVKKPLDYLTSAHLSPTGDRLALTARGQVFVAPLEAGRFVELPRQGETRYRDAQFLPDGKSLLTLSDQSGELEFWQLPADGLGPATQLTTNGTVFRFPAEPSPDGQRLAWSDKDLKFWMFERATQTTTLIVASTNGPITDFSWSPDSQWLAYVNEAANQYPQIHLYHVTNGSRTGVTSDRVDSYSPAWSPDSQWLYFLSDRELRSLVSSPWGQRQPEPFFTETTRILAVALKPDLRWPFASRDELQTEAAPGTNAPATTPAEKEKTEKPASGTVAASSTNSPTAPALIVTNGLATRLYEVPLPAGNYTALSVTAKHLLWEQREVGFGAKTQLKQLEITAKDPKPKTLVEDIRSYELSADRKKLLIRKGDAFHVVASDASAPAKLEETFDLSGWTCSLLPREEWRQVLTESWRMLRDYFYDRNLHGLDWSAIRQKYLPLLDRISDRSELSEIISEMAGELSALHIYVRYGDVREGSDKIPMASLGARLDRTNTAAPWQIDHIYRTDPEYPNQVSPLARTGIELREGDRIERINGRPTAGVAHPEMLLRNQAGKPVRLEVQSAGATTNRSVLVKPVTAEQAALLRYSEWEFTRRKTVETVSSNQIGYVHLRAMGSDNIAEWAREFYPVFDRPGLIIDVRHNRGGNIDSWILGKLLRKAWFYWQPRVGQPTWNMQHAFRGHVVVLCNQRTASDGEAFAEGFHRLGLGKVIGTRTWGGEIWLSASRWLVDGGMATAAETGVYGPEGAWLIEGHGVEPDIVVDNLPHATFDGRDAQLEAAIQHLQDLIAREPRPIPAPPRYPDKRFPK